MSLLIISISKSYNLNVKDASVNSNPNYKNKIRNSNTKKYTWNLARSLPTTIIVGIIATLLLACSNTDNLSVSACSTVTEIIDEQLNSDTTCKRVDIDEEVSEGFYLATAILSNGKKVEIAITEEDNDMIYVEIVNGGLYDADMITPIAIPRPAKNWERKGDPIMSSDELHGRDEVNSETDGRFSGVDVALSDAIENNNEEFYDIPTNPNTLPGEEYYEGEYNTDDIEIRLSQEEIDELNENAVY